MFATTGESQSRRWTSAVGAAIAGVVLAEVVGLRGAWQTPREWPDYAGGPDSSRFVAATGIDKANVGRLAVAWTYPAGNTDFNPLVARGVAYGRTRGTALVALDAATALAHRLDRDRLPVANLNALSPVQNTGPV